MTTKTFQQNTSPLEKPTDDSGKLSLNDTVVSLTPELNIEEWRAMLTEFTRGLKTGDISPAAANAFANLMGKGLSSYKLQLEYAKVVGRTPNIPALLPMQKKSKP